MLFKTRCDKGKGVNSSLSAVTVGFPGTGPVVPGSDPWSETRILRVLHGTAKA